MKKLLLVAAACVALASCVKNEMDFGPIDESPIGFQAVQGLESTRAATALPDASTFLATAYMIEGDKTNYTNWDSAAAGDKEVYFVDQEVKKQTSGVNAGKWTTDTPYYWPKQGRLTFYAYTPKGVTAPAVANATKNYEIAAYDVNIAANKNKDLMVADLEKNLNANDVPAVFRHKLTNVLFTVKKATGDARTITLTKVQLKGLQHVGKYSMPYNYAYGSVEDEWVPTAATADYDLLTADVPVNSDTATPVAVTQNYFLPQAFTDTKVVYIEYTIQNGGSSETVKNTFKLSELDNLGSNDDKWLMNDQVTYAIEIAGPTQIIWTPSVEGWKSESNVIAI